MGQPLIIILGATTSGKSELAVFLAKKINGEIISVDSRQVYKNLDIGTGKVKGKWQEKNGWKKFTYKNIIHHCIDFVPAKKRFNAAMFKLCAKKAIAEVYSAGRIPILAGGSGFWIDTVAYDLSLPEVPPNEILRKKLSKKSADELFSILKKIDPARADEIDNQNPRRLIRAIEIAKVLGKIPTIEKKNPYNILWIGIKISKNDLKTKIVRRLKKRFSEGLVAEGRMLRKTGFTWKKFYELGLEYKFLADFLRGRMARSEMETALAKAIVDYARRQMVWFKRNKNIRWIKNRQEAKEIAQEFLIKSHPVPPIGNEK